MKILVTGGSGFIGGHLIRRLLKAGHEVDVLIRPSSQVQFLEDSSVQKLYGDLFHLESLNDIEGEWEVAINTAGLMGKFGITRKQLFAVNALGTESLFRLCRKRGVKQFIHLSTVGVTGPSDNQFLDENYICKPSNDYEESKYEGEKKLSNLYGQNGCDVTVIRVGFTYGPEDLHKLSLFQAINRNKFFLIGSGNNLLQSIYIEDLIEGINKAIEQRPKGNQVFNMCGNPPVTWKEFTATLAGQVGGKIPAFHIPRFLADHAATLFEITGKIFLFNPILTHSRVSLLTQSYTYSIERAKNTLGFVPEVDIKEGLLRTIDWYRERDLI
ncbi:hypothetical protein UR09_03005 [Candidatus Nitromaritima sp. SCGC AAA799-A02]|nr:hypothetical protein UR09_03005 [Candidatus Nitromaritima sp. SCGC AAA799-A02]